MCMIKLSYFDLKTIAAHECNTSVIKKTNLLLNISADLLCKLVPIEPTES